MVVRIVLVSILILLSSCSLANKPNVVFIFADDMSYKTAGFMGHDVVKTPNLDQLANHGVVFDRAYNMGAWTGAVCISSRTMLNAGLSVWKAQKIDKLFANNKATKSLSNDKALARKAKQNKVSDTFWAARMSQAGYDTYITGKWHIKKPAQTSFDQQGTVTPGMPKQTDTRYNRTFARDNDNWSPYDTSFGGFWEGGQHWSESLADEAIEYIDSKKKSDKPFFMYVSFNAPHDPRQAPKEFVDMYPLDDINLPASYIDQNPHMLTMGLLFPNNPKKKITRDEALGPLPRTEYSTLINRQEYYASITHMDSQIGRIVEQLEANGQLDNTVIIFTADHGLAIGEHGLLGKQNLFEHSMRAPFFIYGKNIPNGERRVTPIYLQDAMATSLDIAGATIDNIDFNSLLPTIKDQNAKPYSSIYGAYLDTQRAIIVGDYKLILYPKGKVIQLYNLANDPDELTNLADKANMQDKIKTLFQALLQEQVTQKDSLDLKAIFPTLI